MSQRILITGAAGKVGTNLIRRLTERGHQVRALDLPTAPIEARLKAFSPETIAGDFADPDVCARAVDGVDAVVNLASIRHFIPNQAHFEIDTIGTYNMLVAAARGGTVKRFVQASSAVSYGPALYEPVDEDHPQRPNNTLGLTKVTAEVMCKAFGAEYGLPTVRLRFAWVLAGPDFLNVPFRFAPVLQRARQTKGQPGGAEALSRLEALAAQGEERLLAVSSPDGRPWLSQFVDIRDLVSHIGLVLEHPAAVGEAFNVTSVGPVSSTAGAPYLADRIGLPCDDVTMPVASTANISWTKSRLLLGYTPEFDFFRSVDDALRMRAGEEIGVVPL